jgi:hypothetical protein
MEEKELTHFSISEQSAKKADAPFRESLENQLTVFLGGTCNGSVWRNDLARLLSNKVRAFNPVVSVWDERAKFEEKYHREHDDVRLYCITPAISGIYSIAEVVDDSNKKPDSTVLCVLNSDFGGAHTFTKHQADSMRAFMELVEANGVEVFDNLYDVSVYLNNRAEHKVK